MWNAVRATSASSSRSLPIFSRGIHTSRLNLFEAVAYNKKNDRNRPEPNARYPKWYFDFKSFRQGMKVKKQLLDRAEQKEVEKAFAPPPPEGWTVQKFLEQMGIGDSAEDIAACFESWEDFVSVDYVDLKCIAAVTITQRPQILRHIKLFKHGLWPEPSLDEYQKRFAGKPIENANKPFTAEDDKQLLELAEFWDASFGNPWLYVSYDMKRTEEEVRTRYYELVTAKRHKTVNSELALTRSYRPLYLNRRFRVMPPHCCVVPTTQHFKTPEVNFQLSPAFLKFRKAECFHEPMAGSVARISENVAPSGNKKLNKKKQVQARA